MNLYEYQARALLAERGIPVPTGAVARTVREARAIAERIGGLLVIKAQVHAGGRGKAGGVKLAHSADEAAAHTTAILRLTIKGLPVNQVLVSSAVDIAREYYVSILIDRATKAPMIMASSAGGMDIEEVAATAPEKIVKVGLRADRPMTKTEAAAVAAQLGFRGSEAQQAADIFRKMETVFWASDASLVEVNPLVVTPTGKLWAVDAKISLDDSALFRHDALAQLRDESAEDPREVAARHADLSFVGLQGTIGCCVNGAGLAMATMDLVKYFGGEPANFLDIGGSSNPAKVVNAMRILTSDPDVRAVLINIFGGITRCDDVARGILTALDEIQIKLPIVIRLTGTREAEAKELLKKEGRGRLIWASTMDEAVQKVIAAAGGVAGRSPSARATRVRQ